MTNTPTPTPMTKEELRERLIDKLDDQRFGDNVVNRKLLHKDIVWIVDELIPVITEQARLARLTDNHDWDTEMFKKQNVIVCRRCATTYQIRGNKPCKGKMAKVGLRQLTASEEGRQ